MTLTPLPHDAARDAHAAVPGDLQAPPAAPAPPASGLETGEGGRLELVVFPGRSLGNLQPIADWLDFVFDNGTATGPAYRITVERL